MAGSGLILRFDVLHCDKASWFRHIEAPTVGFVVQALIVSGDNGLSAAATVDEISVRRLQSSRAKWDFRTHVGGSNKQDVGCGGAAAVGACARRLLDIDRGFAAGRHAGRAPARPKEAGAYLPVEDLPPDRDEAAMAPADRPRSRPNCWPRGTARPPRRPPRTSARPRTPREMTCAVICRRMLAQPGVRDKRTPIQPQIGIEDTQFCA